MIRVSRPVLVALTLIVGLAVSSSEGDLQSFEAFAASPPADVSYNSVDFVDRDNGWVAGNGGTVLRTRNGGSNWQVLDVGTTDDFVSVSFADVQKGWALTRGARTWRTTDGGTTWSLMAPARYSGTDLVTGVFFTPEAHAIEFPTADRGFFSANKFAYSGSDSNVGILYRSAAGGGSWGLTPVLVEPDYRHPDDWVPVGESQFRDIEFVSESTGWVVGIDYYPARVSPWLPKPIVYRTTTAGSSGSWMKQTLPTATDFTSLNGISFADASVGIAVGDNGRAVRTTNGGTTWSLIPSTGTTRKLNDVFVLDATSAWAVGEGGTIKRTTDGGVTWTDGWAQSATGSLRSVQLTGGSLLGWLAGADGRIRITTDGQNWYPPVPQPSVLRVPSEYASIAAAVAAAVAGDVIEVSGGTYLESVLVDKSVSIRSAAGEQVTIVAADSSAPVVDVRADGVVIDGTGSGHGITLLGPAFAGVYCDGFTGLKLRGIVSSGSGYGAFLSNSPGALIEESELSLNQAAGLALYHASDGATVRNSTFVGNDYGIYSLYADEHSVLDTIVDSRFYGVFLDQSSGNTFYGVAFQDNPYAGLAAYFASHDNVVSGSSFTGNGFGVYLYSSSGNTISGSTVGPNAFYGVFFEAAPGNNVDSGSSVTGNPYAGVAAYYGSDDATVEDCIVAENGFGVYVALSDSTTVSGSTVSDNLFYGVFLESTTGATIDNNAIARNPYVGIVTQSSDSTTVQRNAIRENGWGSYSIGSTSSWWSGNGFLLNASHAFDDGVGNAYDDGASQGNYWDTWLGPDADQDGIVDVPYQVPGGECLDRFPHVTALP
ncbi:MAG: NosD domain-containing protein [Anaerosomatales bacterium]|nr:NosD domain-containing protein [Anaerosomatales bacterium]